MRLIIKGPLKCSGARAFAWVSSGKSVAFHLDVYGFMHGTTYCLIGHHSNDIVAVGSTCLGVNGWIRAWVCFCTGGKIIKKENVCKSRSGFIHRWTTVTHLHSGVNGKAVDSLSDSILSFLQNYIYKILHSHAPEVSGRSLSEPPDRLTPWDQISDH